MKVVMKRNKSQILKHVLIS